MPGVVGQLNSRERAELARYLLQSLEPERDGAVAKAWQKEIARRVREIRAGKGQRQTGGISLRRVTRTTPMKPAVFHDKDLLPSLTSDGG